MTVMASLGLYIYDNSGRGWGTEPYAKIHVGSCSFCNYGKGVHGVKEADRVNDEWRGPFQTREEAVEAAQLLMKPVSFCPCVDLFDLQTVLGPEG